MKGEILSVGTELLLGHLVDTNAPWLAQSLSSIGVDVFWIGQVGDNQARLVEALRRGWERSDLIVVSGGMGPTGDDLTREAIAEMLGEEMVVQPHLEAELRAFFARRGRAMPERNVKQATLIPSAEALANPIGTAPGWWVERDGRIVVAMPGVPVEMKRMWDQEVLPRLARLSGAGVILSRTVKVLGLGESSVEEQLRDLTTSPNPTLATYAKDDGIHVRITAKAPSRDAALEMVQDVEARVREILGDNIYGVDEETIADAVMRLLVARGLTVGTMELGTFGRLISELAAASEGLDRLLGGMVAGDVEALHRLGVHMAMDSGAGLMSEEVVRAMAGECRERLSADVGLAVLCGMEDESGQSQRLGVVMCAVDDRGTAVTGVTRYTTTAREVRRRAVLDAIDLLRRRLLAI